MHNVLLLFEIVSGYARRCQAPRVRALNQESVGGCIREYLNECTKPETWYGDMIRGYQPLRQVGGLHH
jgi:hypothetical protein